MKKLLFNLMLSSLLACAPLLVVAADKSVEVTNFPPVQPVSGAVSVDNLPATQHVTGSVEVTNLPPVQSVSGTVSVDNLPETQDVTGTVEVSNLPLDTEGHLIVSAQPQSLPEIYTHATDVQIPDGSYSISKDIPVPAGKRLVLEYLGLLGTSPNHPEPQNGELYLELGPPGDRSSPQFIYVINRLRLLGSQPGEHLLHIAPQSFSFALDGPRTYRLRIERDQSFGWYSTWISLYGHLVDLPN